MSSKLKIRHAIPNDIGRLLKLYSHLIPDEEPCSTDLANKSFAEFLRYAGSAILLGEIDKILIASCAVVIVPNLTRGGAPYALIENVVTHTDYRGMGHGKAILEAASQLAWENACYKVMLMTGSQNSSTLEFYERAGFEQSKTGFQKRRRAVRSEG
jgi:GNAT superfamily N-acetyltransferase